MYPQNTFVFKDYTNRLFTDPYKGTTPKKRLPFNVNNLDHNILGLSNRQPISPDGKHILFKFERPPRPPEASGLPSMPQDAPAPPLTLTHTQPVHVAPSVPSLPSRYIPSLIHYASQDGALERPGAEREDLIHRQSKVPIQHSTPVPLDEYRKVVSPFGTAKLLQSRDRALTPRDCPRPLLGVKSQTPHSPWSAQREAHGLLHHKFQGVYTSARDRDVKRSQATTSDGVVPAESLATDRGLRRPLASAQELDAHPNDPQATLQPEEDLHPSPSLWVPQHDREETVRAIPLPKSKLKLKPKLNAIEMETETNIEMAQKLEGSQTDRTPHQAEWAQRGRLRTPLQQERRTGGAEALDVNMEDDRRNAWMAPAASQPRTPRQEFQVQTRRPSVPSGTGHQFETPRTRVEQSIGREKAELEGIRLALQTERKVRQEEAETRSAALSQEFSDRKHSALKTDRPPQPAVYGASVKEMLGVDHAQVRHAAQERERERLRRDLLREQVTRRAQELERRKQALYR